MNTHTWKPGDRVRWDPSHAEPDYQSIAHGTVADAPAWPPVDPWIAPGERIPVDLDQPVVGWLAGLARGRPCLVKRLYVRAQFLEPYQEPNDE